MKKLYSGFALMLISIGLSAQCGVQVSTFNASCSNTCDGGATAFSSNTVGPVTYMWMPGGQTTQSVNGLCLITDSSGCTATASVTVIAPPPLQAQITSVTNESCQGCCDGSMTGTATGGVSPYTYMWSPPMVMTPIINNVCSGTYTFCVTDANGCVSCTTAVVNVMTSVQTSAFENSLYIAPNPSEGRFQVNADFGSAQAGTITVTNILGETVSQTAFGETSSLRQEIDLADQSAGTYFVTITTGESALTEMIIVN